MIKAVIFDLDNTLIDYSKYTRYCNSQAVDAMIHAGLKLPRKKALDILYSLRLQNGLDNDFVFEKFLQKVEGRIDYRKLGHAVNAYRKARIDVLFPFKGVRKTLLSLKRQRLKLAIISNAPKLKMWLRLTAMGIDDLFDYVIGLEDTGKAKPHKLPFMTAMRHLKIKPSECIMVGDRPDKDLVGARSVGMLTCFASYGNDGKGRDGTKWDFTIKDITELVKVVSKAKTI